MFIKRPRRGVHATATTRSTDLSSRPTADCRQDARHHLPRPVLWAVLLLILAASSLLLWTPAANADDGSPSSQLLQRTRLGESQIFSEDLTIEADETLRANVVVYSGDAEIRQGGTIEGNLVVYSGDINVEAGGLVTGDVSAFSGDIRIDGTVEGSVASWSGDVTLSEGARVAGDISVLSGDVRGHDQAFVGGNVTRGPSFSLKMPALVGPFHPGAAGLDDAGRPLDREPQQANVARRLGNLFLRLLTGLGIVIVLAPLAALVAYSKPDYVEDLGATIRTRGPLTFALGLVTNVVGGLLIGLLAITLCLVPLALLVFFVLFAVNLVGWTAIAALAGRRIGRWLQTELSTAAAVLVGTMVLALILMPLFAFGGCFRFIAFAAALIIGAFGAGSVIVSWRDGRLGQPMGRLTAGVAGPPQSSSATPASTPPTPPLSGSENAIERVPAAPAAPAAEDDFTEIDGVNAVMDARLKVAGVRTFADLASMSPEAVADIFSWTAEEVQSEGILEKAKVLANLA